MPTPRFGCKHCQKSFTAKQKLVAHEPRCPCRKSSDMILSIEARNKDLEAKNKDMEANNEEIAALLSKRNQEILDLKSVHSQEVLELQLTVSQQQELLKDSEETVAVLRGQIAIYKDLSHSSQQTIASIAHQPRTSSSVHINLPPLTREHLEENAQYLSMDHIKKGFKGYAEYALEFPLKGMVTCTDYARRKVKYNNDNGDVVVDPDMTSLCSNLFSAIRSRNQDLTNEYMSEMKEKTASGKWNRNDIQDLMFEAITRNGDVISIANGERPEAITEFVKWVCSGLTSSS